MTTAEQLVDCMNNPVKARILILLKEKGCMTPKDIMKEDEGMSQATIYRAIKSLEQDGVIEVVSERKVRAVVEKTYGISSNTTSGLENVVRSNNAEAYCKLFTHFAFELLRKFESYSKRENINIHRDGSRFVSLPIYATAEELDMYGEKIMEVLKPALGRTSEEQTLHTMAFVVTPPTGEGRSKMRHVPLNRGYGKLQPADNGGTDEEDR